MSPAATRPSLGAENQPVTSLPRRPGADGGLRAAATCAALLLLSASGCVCTTGGGSSGAKYDVTFLWTFAGSRAAVLSEVKRVSVSIPGQSLQNDGYYPPTANGVDGITLLDFRAGSYTYTVRGLSSTNVLLYEKSGSFTVGGDTTVSVDLDPVSGAPAYAYVTWTFPVTSLSSPSAPTSCAQANGVTRVVISVDNGPFQAFDCDDGFAAGGNPGVLVTSTVGTHTIELSASDRNGFYYFGKRTTLPPLVGGGAIAASFTLDWAVGSLPLKWSFANGYSCAANGVTDVRVDLVDEAGNSVYDAQTGVLVPCDYLGVQGTLFAYLYAGTYRISVQGRGTGGTVFHSDSVTWPAGTVVAGTFPQVDGATPVISLVAP